MFAKRQINLNKTKHEYIPIETEDMQMKSKWENTSTKEVGGRGHHV
jgi:hypothetical protein